MKKVAKRGKRADSEEGVEKVTISILKSQLKLMRRIAKRDHDANLSAAFGALIAEKVRLEAMDRLLAWLPPATAEDMARVRAERMAPLPPPPARRAQKAVKRAAA